MNQTKKKVKKAAGKAKVMTAAAGAARPKEKAKAAAPKGKPGKKAPVLSAEEMAAQEAARKVMNRKQILTDATIA